MLSLFRCFVVSPSVNSIVVIVRLTVCVLWKYRVGPKRNERTKPIHNPRKTIVVLFRKKRENKSLYKKLTGMSGSIIS